jgi:CRP-like cAMP-binding protein
VNIFTPQTVRRHFPDAKERTYAAGQTIIYHGDQPSQVFFVKNGAIKFFDIDNDGNEKILHIGGEGSIAPLFYSFEDKPSVDAYYATLCKTEVLMVPLVSFREKLNTSSQFAAETLRWYATEMDHIVLRLKSMEKSTAKQKILQALYYLSDQHSTQNVLKNEWYRINFPLTQQTLANLTGLTRETVNITLNDPVCQKLIRNNRGQRFEVNKAEVAKYLSE